MNWKSDLRLSDLDSGEEIEVTCKRCRLTRYERAGELLASDEEMQHLHLDEVERMLRCSSRICRGPVRLSLIYDDKTEGFVGGMA